MIDIHAHILPGIDDGAEDMYDTLEMARMAADSGVNRIIATPHCNIPGMYGNYFGREYIDRYESVVRAVRKEKIPIEILPGMEVFSTEDLPELIVNQKIMPLIVVPILSSDSTSPYLTSNSQNLFSFINDTEKSITTTIVR